MRFSFRALIVCLFVGTSIARADTVSVGGTRFDFDVSKIRPAGGTELNSDFDKFTYYFVTESCKASREGALNQIKRMRESAYSSAKMMFDLDIDMMIQRAKRRGLSPLTSLILKSPALMPALEDCYPKNEILQRTYIVSLIVTDLEGLVGGIGMNLMGGFILAKGGVWLISKAVWSPVRYLLTKAQVDQKMISYIKKSLIVGGTAAVGYSTYKDIKDQQKEKLKDAKAFAEMKSDSELKELDEELQGPLQNLQAAKGSQFESFWRENLKAGLANFYLALEQYLTKNKVSEDEKSFWRAKYEIYLRTLNS